MTRPESLELAGYHKLKRERVESVERITLKPADVLVIEGTVALALKAPAAAEVHRFQVEIDEPARAARVLAEYRLRGLAPGEASQVYSARRADEYPVIAELGRTAVRVNIDLAAA